MTTASEIIQSVCAKDEDRLVRAIVARPWGINYCHNAMNAFHHATVIGWKRGLDILNEFGSQGATGLTMDRKQLPLHLAINPAYRTSPDRVEIVQMLIEQFPAGIFDLDNDKKSPFEMVIQRQQLVYFELMAQKLTALRLTQAMGEQTLFQRIVKMNWVPAAEILLKMCEKVGVSKVTLMKIGKKETEWPIFHAVCRGHTEMVEMMIRQGVEVDAIFSQHQTLVHVACNNNQPEMIPILVRGAMLHAQRRWCKAKEHLKLTSEEMPPVDIPEFLGLYNVRRESAMTIAAGDGRLEMMITLIQFGAEIRNALYMVASHHIDNTKRECVKMLRSIGGNNDFAYEARIQRTDVIELLSEPMSEKEILAWRERIYFYPLTRRLLAWTI